MRLILTLLLAVAATMPVRAATPVCHDAVPAMTNAGLATTPARREAPAIGEHGCIGCAALGDWLAERVTAPLLLPAALPARRAIHFRLGATAPPALPPPRIG